MISYSTLCLVKLGKRLLIDNTYFHSVANSTYPKPYPLSSHYFDPVILNISETMHESHHSTRMPSIQSSIHP